MVVSPHLVKVFDLILQLLVLKNRSLVVLIAELFLLIASLSHHLSHLIKVRYKLFIFLTFQI